MSVPTVSGRCARFVAELEPGSAPAEVQTEAKLHVLDTIGCALAGCALDKGTYVKAATIERGGSGAASAIGVVGGVAAEDAAFVNGAFAHALDFDDTHAAAVAHPSSPVVSAALAVAEEQDCSGRETLDAIILGNEIAIRVGMVSPAGFNSRGFHATSLCGVFGGVAAAARLRRLDARTTQNALGIAGSFASGILECMVDGTDPKGIHAGWSAQAAISATRLAAHGATGPARVFEGRHGLYGAFLGEQGRPVEAHFAKLAEEQFADLGERWETPRIAFKPYPACHAVHAAVDATSKALAGTNVRPEDISEIVVAVPDGAVPMVLEPLEQKQRPSNGYAAKFSIPYSVASMAVNGHVDLSTYAPPALRNPSVLELAQRVRYEIREFATYPGYFPAAVRIRAGDGRELTAAVERQRGGPGVPMAETEIVRKYQDNAGLALTEDAVRGLEQAIVALELESDLSTLAELRAAQVQAALVA